MGWRFRRSIKIFPGVKINIGKESASISIGTRGFHRTYSSTGRVTTSFGIPGTGLSYTTSTNSRNSTSTNTGTGRNPYSRDLDLYEDYNEQHNTETQE